MIKKNISLIFSIFFNLVGHVLIPNSVNVLTRIGISFCFLCAGFLYGEELK